MITEKKVLKFVFFTLTCLLCVSCGTDRFQEPNHDDAPSPPPLAPPVGAGGVEPDIAMPPQPCNPHMFQKCLGNDVYWHDSCGQREELSQACTAEQTCSIGQCILPAVASSAVAVAAPEPAPDQNKKQDQSPIPAPALVSGPVASDVHARYFALSCATLDLMNIANVKCHGAMGDGVTDDTNVFTNLLKGASYRVILVPAGAYLLSANITGNGPIILGQTDGDKPISILKVSDKVDGANSPLESVILLGNGGTLQNLTIDANHRAREGILMVYPSYLLINISIRNALQAGIHADSAEGTRFEKIVVEDNGGDGLWCESCNGATFHGLVSRNNGGYGFQSSATSSIMKRITSSGLYFEGGLLEGNARGGIYLDGPKSITLIKKSIIKSDTSAIELFAAQNVRLMDNQLESTASASAVPFILIHGVDSNKKIAMNNLVENNIFRNTESRSSDIVIQNDSSNNWVVNNKRGILDKGQEIIKPVRVSFETRNFVLNGPPDKLLADEKTARFVRYSDKPLMAPSWKIGDVLLNPTPTTSNLGWHCESKNGGVCVWKTIK